MMREKDVIYRKGMSEEELQNARGKTEKERVKSHANEGAFAGFMLFSVISKLLGASILYAAILGGIGSAFGFLIGHLEASYREKKLEDKNK